MALLLCAGAGAATGQAGAAPGLEPTVCLALETAPRPRVGIAWTAPMLSMIPPLMLAPAKVCFQVPSFLAPQGMLPLPRELAFP